MNTKNVINQELERMKDFAKSKKQLKAEDLESTLARADLLLYLNKILKENSNINIHEKTLDSLITILIDRLGPKNIIKWLSESES